MENSSYWYLGGRMKFIDTFFISFIEPIITVQWALNSNDGFSLFFNVAQKNDFPHPKIISIYKLQNQTIQIIYTGCKDWILHFNEQLTLQGFEVCQPIQVGLYLSPQEPTRSYTNELLEFFSRSNLPFNSFIQDSHGSLFVFSYEKKDLLVRLIRESSRQKGIINEGVLPV